MHHSILIIAASAFLATPLPPFEAPPAVAAQCGQQCPTKLPRPVRTGPARQKLGPPLPPLFCRVSSAGAIKKCGWTLTSKFVPEMSGPPLSTGSAGTRYRASGRIQMAVTEQGKYIY